MEHAIESEPLEQPQGSDRKQSLVFLDTNVILAYLHGDRSATKLFSAEANGRIRFAVNPIVLQELLLASNLAGQPQFEQIRDHLHVLPVDLKKAEDLLPSVRKIRNSLVHSNDILIFSSAEECDFLVTNDLVFKDFSSAPKPQVLTPEEFVTLLAA